LGQNHARDDNVNPGENFGIVSGEILNPEKREAAVKGKEHRERYRIKARIGKYFDLARLWLGDDALTISQSGTSRRFRFIFTTRWAWRNCRGFLTMFLSSFPGRLCSDQSGPAARRTP
jgi:hypothetical protein